MTFQIESTFGAVRSPFVCRWRAQRVSRRSCLSRPSKKGEDLVIRVDGRKITMVSGRGDLGRQPRGDGGDLNMRQ